MRLSREAIQRMVGGATVGSVGGSGGGSADLSGYATETWVSDNYVSIEFFSKLFKAYDDTTEVLPNDMQSEIDNIRAMFGLWTNDYLSALGLNSSGGGGGGSTLFEPLSSINEAGLSDHPSSSGQTIVWNGSAWVYGTAGGSGSVTSVGLSVPTGFSVSGSPVTSSGTLALTFATGYSLPTTAKQGQWDTAYSNSHTHDNYNVLDGITLTQVGNWDTAYTNSHTHTNKSVLDGITSTKVGNWDTAYTNSHTHSNKSVLDGITSTKVSNWDTAYGWGDHASAGYALASNVYSKTDADAKFLTIAAFENLFNAMNSSGQKVSHPYSSAVASIKAMVGLYTDQFLSALGLGSGGGGGSTSLSDLVDVLITSPSNGQVLKYNSTSGKWVNANDQSGSGTVTSVGISMPTGFSVSGSPITTSGTLAISFATGYSLPTTAKQGNWDTAYTNSHTHSNKSVLDAITSTKTGNWDTAYGWGDHSQAGYATQTWVTNQGYTTNTGTVTSVKLTVPTGFSVSGSPITTSGTLALSFATGYSLPTTTKQGQWDTAYTNNHTHSNKSVLDGITSTKVSNWDTAYGWGNHASAGYALAADVYSKTAADAKFLTIAAFENLFNAMNSSGQKVSHPYSSAVASIKAMVGLYTDQFLSALGLGSGGGGGSTSLSDLVDVLITSPSNGQVLKYNSTSGKWVNANDQSGSGTVTSVTAGTGLSGGTITTSGTIAISSTYQTYISHGESAYNNLSNYLPLTGGILSGGLGVCGRLYNSGDDEGIVITPASNNYAGVILGSSSGRRSIFYLNAMKAFWRYNNGTTSYDINHPEASGTIALQSWVQNQGYTTNTGTVTSVNMTVPTGFSVSGSPISTIGTLALSFAAGYSLPTTAKQGQWDNAYSFTSSSGFGTTGSDYVPITLGGTTKNVLTSHQSLADYLPLSAGSGKRLTGSLYFNSTGLGVYFKDPASNDYPAIVQNSSNLWIGAASTASYHHRGQTYISAGHDGTSGNSTIYVCVPNAANNGGTNYGVWHAGNIDPVGYKYVGTSALTSESGSFFFGGSGTLQTGYDYVGFQVGNSEDKWQMVAIDNLKWRQNDSGGTSTAYGSWRTLVDSSNLWYFGVPAKYQQKDLSSAGWYRVADVTAYGLSFLITFYGGYNNNPPVPVTFLVSHSYSYHSITQVGSCAYIGRVQIVRLVHYANGKIYVDFYYNGSNTNPIGVQITPLDNKAANPSYISLVDFTSVSATLASGQSEADRAYTSRSGVKGNYTMSGGQQAPDYFGMKNVGFLMSNQAVNGDSTYKDWMYMDNYWGSDAGGTTAIGVSRSNGRMFVMRSDSSRSSWNTLREVAVLDTNGYLGLGYGTTTPQYQLDVNGAARVTELWIGGIHITADAYGILVANGGLAASTYVSALGVNSSGGGSSTLLEPLYSINQAGLAAHPSSSGKTIVWNGSSWVYGTAGGASTLGDLTNVTLSSPTNGQVLVYNSLTGKWVNGTISSSGGTVTSVGVSMPTGFSVSNSPITSSGTIAISFASGYSLPTTSKQSNWDTAYSFTSNSGFPSGGEDFIAIKLNGTSHNVLTQHQSLAGYLTSSSALNASNITSGTVAFARLPNLYWANVAISSSSSTTTTPQFGNIRLNSGSAGTFLRLGSSTNGCYIKEGGGDNRITYAGSYHSFIGGDLYVSSNLNINGFVVEYDEDNNALKFNGTIYATGGVSALGLSSESGSSISSNLLPSSANLYTLGSSTNYWSNVYSKYLRLYDGTKYSYIHQSGSLLGIQCYDDMYIGTDDLIIDTQGNLVLCSDVVEYPSYAVEVHGNMYCTSSISAQSVTQRSDMRNKTVISDLNLSVQSVANAPSFKYKFKDDGDTTLVGTSAQYWDVVLPQVVFKDADTGTLSLDYGVTALASVICVAKGVSEHERRIAQLETENKILRAEIEDLKNA